VDGILSLESLSIVMAFVVPGFIALSVRAQFVSGVTSFDARERLLSYLSISIIYGSLVLRLVGPNLILNSTSVFLLALIGGPVLLGLILGVNVQNDIFRRLLGKLGLFTVHPVLTAWDWKFAGSMKEQWVLVTLKNGVSFAGLYGRESFCMVENHLQPPVRKKETCISSGFMILTKTKLGLLSAKKVS